MSREDARRLITHQMFILLRVTSQQVDSGNTSKTFDANPLASTPKFTVQSTQITMFRFEFSHIYLILELTIIH